MSLITKDRAGIGLRAIPHPNGAIRGKMGLNDGWLSMSQKWSKPHFETKTIIFTINPDDPNSGLDGP